MKLEALEAALYEALLYGIGATSNVNQKVILQAAEDARMMLGTLRDIDKFVSVLSRPTKELDSIKLRVRFVLDQIDKAPHRNHNERTSVKTSQLIQRLHEAIQHYGDLEVYMTEFTHYPRRLFDLPKTSNGSAPDDIKLVQIHVVLL